MSQGIFTDEQRKEIREELLRVRAQAGEIDRAYMFEDSGQRVMLTLPKSLVHLAKFIAIMESRPADGALSFWQYISGEGQDDPIPCRNAMRMMRAWMEEEIMTRTHVALLQLQAEVKEKE